MPAPVARGISARRQGNDLLGMADQDVGEVLAVFEQSQTADDGIGQRSTAA